MIVEQASYQSTSQTGCGETIDVAVQRLSLGPDLLIYIDLDCSCIPGCERRCQSGKGKGKKSNESKRDHLFWGYMIEKLWVYILQDHAIPSVESSTGSRSCSMGHPNIEVLGTTSSPVQRSVYETATTLPHFSFLTWIIGKSTLSRSTSSLPRRADLYPRPDRPRSWSNT